MVRLGLAAAGERVPPSELEDLGPAIERVYRDLEARGGPLPSIWLASQSTLQSSARFDALISEPAAHTRLGVVFLHGYGGNFTWPCASVAAAVEAVNGTTLCPSVGDSGRWWTGAGPAIVLASIRALEARGIDTIVLAGLSNGGIGASRLVARFADRLGGLLLVSGAARGTRTSLRTLLIHGSSDRMAPLGAARAFVRASTHATLEVFEGGHFVLAHREPEIRARVAEWLGALTASL